VLLLLFSLAMSFIHVLMPLPDGAGNGKRKGADQDTFSGRSDNEDACCFMSQ
jgi:hypothetical protein